MSLTIDDFNAAMASNREEEHAYQAAQTAKSQAAAKHEAEKDAVDKQHLATGQLGVSFLGESFALVSSRSPQQAIQTGMKMTISALKLLGAVTADLFGAMEYAENYPKEFKKNKTDKNKVSNSSDLDGDPDGKDGGPDGQPPSGGNNKNGPNITPSGLTASSGTTSSPFGASQVSITHASNSPSQPTSETSNEVIASAKTPSNEGLSSTFLTAANGDQITAPLPTKIFKANIGSLAVSEHMQANSTAITKLAM